MRALGSRHSFSDLADTTGTLVDLAGLPRTSAAAMHRRRPRSRSAAAARYGDLAVALDEQGWALGAMASLPHISVAGAVATGTHGSGDDTGSLATAVSAVELVGPDGGLRRLARGDEEFDGSVVALGALGIVTRLELDVEPTYAVSQQVRTGLTWDVLESRFDDITGAAYSVSIFTRFGDGVEQLWLKDRVGEERSADRFGTVAATGVVHMLSGGALQAVTEQGGWPGPWMDRLPHFRMAFTPSSGEELQTRVLRGARARPRGHRPVAAAVAPVPGAAPGRRDPHRRP